MRFEPTRAVASALLMAIGFVNALSAQTTTSGGLTGVITDQSKAVLPDAVVELRDEAKGITKSTKTDRQGVYRFFFLAPASYTLSVTREGFRQERRAVNVLLGPPGTVNITLEISKTSSEITVTDEAPLIQAENGDISATVTRKQISEVPNPGNDLTYLAQTTPGAVMNTDIQGGANFSILGMPGTSYVYTIDGLNETDNSSNAGPLVGSLQTLLGQNQIQEATVVSTGYSGQFSGAAGGNVNYFTKSGDNHLHGNAQYYWNGRIFNANDWFNTAFGKPRPFDIANQWAGSLGGPIKANKLFFFFDTEGLRLLVPQLFFVVIPSPEFEAATIANIDSIFGTTSASDAFYKRIFGLYNAAPGARSATPGGLSPASDPTGCTGFSDLKTGLGVKIPCAVNFLATRGRPSQDSLIAGRLDWNVSYDDRAYLRLQYEDGGSIGYSDPVSSLFDSTASLGSWQAQMIETHTFSSIAASQFLLAGLYHGFINQVSNPSQTLAAFPTVLDFSASGTFTNLGGQDNFFAHGFGRYNTQYQASEDVMRTSGSHKLGFGANFERIYWTLLGFTINQIGVLSPQTLDAFYRGGRDAASPGINYTQLSQSFYADPSERFAFYNLGLYGQDEWHARPDLTLTLAARAEHKSNPTCKHRCFARLAGPFESVSHDPNQPYNQAIITNQKQALEGLDNVLWSPRFSFAWQPFGLSHSMVLRGGAGIFYDSMIGYVSTGASYNPPEQNSYTVAGNNLSPGEKTNLFEDAAAANAGFVSGFTAGKTLAQIQVADPNFFPPALTAFQKQMHFPQYQKWSLEWQQGVGNQAVVSIGYFGHHGIHELIENRSANAYGFGSLPAGLCASPPVPPCADPRFSGVTATTSAAVSNYNGMVVSIRHRFSRWSQGLFQVNYSYSHTFDEVSNGGDISFTTGSSQNPQDPNNLRGAYGPAEYDVRHSLNANYVWEVPMKTALHGHGPEFLVKGWHVSGTLFARTGFPYTVFDLATSFHLQKNNYFGLLYAVPVGPPSSGACGEGAALPLSPRPCQPAQVLANGNPNPNARFVQATCETGFNTGNLPDSSGLCNGRAVASAQRRNRFRGPGYFNTDFAILKNTKIARWENGVLGIGFQFFNLFNHPNFGFPDNYVSDPAFGQILYLEQSPTSILGAGLGGDAAPRMIQLRAQLQF